MAENDQISPWWSVARHADIRPFLAARSAITRAIRAWFDEQGFAEVETGILQVSPGNETHLHAPRTELTGADGAHAMRYLRTSPEFACKKLLAAGEQKIFEFARVFRDRERGDLHLPEFTMLEWYRADAAYDAVMADSVVMMAKAIARVSPLRQSSGCGSRTTTPGRISSARCWSSMSNQTWGRGV
jgi:lysyl-tRNA synthetase class 2